MELPGLDNLKPQGSISPSWAFAVISSTLVDLEVQRAALGWMLREARALPTPHKVLRASQASALKSRPLKAARGKWDGVVPFLTRDGRMGEKGTGSSFCLKRLKGTDLQREGDGQDHT